MPNEQAANPKVPTYLLQTIPAKDLQVGDIIVNPSDSKVEILEFVAVVLSADDTNIRYRSYTPYVMASTEEKRALWSVIHIIRPTYDIFDIP